MIDFLDVENGKQEMFFSVNRSKVPFRVWYMILSETLSLVILMKEAMNVCVWHFYHFNGSVFQVFIWFTVDHEYVLTSSSSFVK